MKVNNTCDNCIKRKQFEDRIMYLESMLFNHHLSEAENSENYAKPVEQSSPLMDLSSDVQEFLFKDRPELLQVLDLRWLDIDIAFLTICAQNSLAVNYLLYGLASLVAPPNYLAFGLNNNETARAYFGKAETFANNAISDYSLNAVVIFLLLSLAVHQALEFGINNEATIANMTLFDYERGVYRKLWWAIYEYDVYLGANKIVDMSNLLYLPFPDGVSELESEDSDFGLQIMNSTDWFTPGFQNQSTVAYKLLLCRIHHKISKYEAGEYKQKVSSEKFIMKALESSLDAWYQSLPDSIKNAVSLLQFQYQSISTLNSDSADYQPLNQNALLDPKLLYLQLYYNYLNIYIRLLRIAQVYKMQHVSNFTEYKEALEFARNSQVWLELHIKSPNDVALYPPFFCNIILLSSIPLIMEGKITGSGAPYSSIRQILSSCTNEQDGFASDIFDMLANAKDVSGLFAVYFEIKIAKQL
ncbi:hypothetical protein HK103_006211 [Boothiomyces macroporosus]|uniref:Transcription factor domain-containing protein n=1 Tax=Boothiomyces macroporosus TaxID=261099 RepID=A0AAD5UEH4_9FUNG|nr:hypothetical protein HK103_006211 [Boothiomyces macroporosus]